MFNFCIVFDKNKKIKMNLLLCSTSTIHGTEYLDYCKSDIKNFFQGKENILFVPYARPGGISYDDYTDKARNVFAKLDLNIIGIHELNNPPEQISKSEGIFIGGGNTFLLLSTLYQTGQLELIKESVKNGAYYMGTSAGTNIATPNIKTTNDMPIIYPPSFDSFGFVNFNINPHYLDPDLKSKHMGETRETRLKEFHFYNDNIVVGLREGSILKIENTKIELLGPHSIRIFEKNKEAREYSNSDNLEFLLS